MKNLNLLSSLCGVATFLASGCFGIAEAKRSVLSPRQNFSNKTQVVQWQASSQNVSEGVGTVQATAVLNAASTVSISVPYTIGGSASLVSDHGAVNGTLTIPAGSTTASLSIAIVNDTLVEQNETLVLTLGTPVGAVLGTVVSHTITIQDNDVVTPSPTPSPTVSPKPSPTPSPTVSPKPSPTPSPTATVTPVPTFTTSPVPVPTGSGVAYYFSSSQGDDSRTSTEARNPATPWKNINKLNSIFGTLNPGDSVLFKRGDVFYGSLAISRSGTSSSLPMILGAYGTGGNPKITGLTTLTNWNNLGNGIYSTSVSAPNINMVVMNGVPRAMGRYPNTGYLNYESHSGNTSITDLQLPGTPSWVGAEVVIRKYRWILDRQTVTAHSGGTLTYNALRPYGNNAFYNPIDKNGYFIQNHLGTLDQLGEWYFNPANSTLYMYFGTSTPSAYSIHASTQDSNANVNSKSYIVFSNLDFEGGNTQGAYVTYSNHISFLNCNFVNQGGNAIYGLTTDYVDIKGGSILNSLNAGIWFEHQGFHTTIDGVSVRNSGTIPGAMRSGDSIGGGITVMGGDTAIRNNQVLNSGFNGINFSGNNVVVENNYVDTFCTVKDDCGGVYTYGASGGNLNRTIRNNVILNAIGAAAGAEAYASYEGFGKAAGIYLDDHSENVLVSGNSIAHGQWGGIFVHNSRNNQLVNNIVYNHQRQLMFTYYDTTFRNVTRTGNQFVSRLANQHTFYDHVYLNENPGLTGNSDYNYYARPLNESGSLQFHIEGIPPEYLSLAQWQSRTSQDLHSKVSPKAITDVNNMRFEYNATNASKTIPLDGTYISIDGRIFSNQVVLQPFTSVVLIRN